MRWSSPFVATVLVLFLLAGRATSRKKRKKRRKQKSAAGGGARQGETWTVKMGASEAIAHYERTLASATSDATRSSMLRSLAGIESQEGMAKRAELHYKEVALPDPIDSCCSRRGPSPIPANSCCSRAARPHGPHCILLCPPGAGTPPCVPHRRRRCSPPAPRSQRNWRSSSTVAETAAATAKR